ncbi:palmitoyltransferase (PFA3) [Vairimorpha necatrix]|uniref:Palmitoyltransferase n=1 Tax=Vairimorpha necatrix TaxID=6039 RepID=A0AAX4J8Y2_9MICR
MDCSLFFKDIIRVIQFTIYPMLQLYAYFVLVGLYCLEQKKFDGWETLLIFFFYHLLATTKVIFYMKLLINEGYSTLELFPVITEGDRKLDLEGINLFLEEDILVKNMQKLKNCHICKTYKPPRAHHCSICNRCYLKFDHHCIFLDTCIGFHNYKFYYQFLFLNMCTSLFFILVTSMQLRKNLMTSLRVNYIVSISLISVFMLIILFIFVFHTRTISNNETLVEFRALNSYIMGDHRYVHIFQEGAITNYTNSNNRKVLNPYNLSTKENWIQVFGYKYFDWIKPTMSSIGDGTSFPKNYTDLEMEYVNK